MNASELPPGTCTLLDLLHDLGECFLLERQSGRLLTRTNREFGNNKNLSLQFVKFPHS
jgi:hypothetical protein